MQILVCYFRFLLALPAFIAYSFCSQQVKQLVSMDVSSFIQSHYYQNQYSKWKRVSPLIFIFSKSPSFRSIFYSRVGGLSRLALFFIKGEKFSCRNNTTIGNKGEGDVNKKPLIGNNVNVGANVCIIGGISIGDNVVIGAGLVVVKDVPDNCIVAGNPARIIRKI